MEEVQGSVLPSTETVTSLPRVEKVREAMQDIVARFDAAPPEEQKVVSEFLGLTPENYRKGLELYAAIATLTSEDEKKPEESAPQEVGSLTSTDMVKGR